MVFNSLTFLLFFGAVLLLHWLPLPWRSRKLNLLLASYLFYAAWNPPFVILIWISTVVDWFAAGRMPQARTPARRRALLVASLATNLGLLGAFKYGNFLLANFVALAGSLGIDYQPPPMDIVLPVGISFYTFQTLSYTIDVYRGKLRPWNSFLDFALFVTFFPQLVAGPIVRASYFLPQLNAARRASSGQLGWGLTLLTIGLFEKVVLADAISAPVADLVYSAAGQAGFLDAWLGTLAFSAQIFFDFAGYSTCAIGIALCLGFALPDNFRYPYAAIGFSDFWRRWHISLSSWLRDYLYIPLGGNRRGRARTHVNLAATMLLGGLWHGAAWRFVAWGGLHGLYLVVERRLQNTWGHVEWLRRAWVRVGLALVTYALVCLTWVFFRAQNFGDAWQLVTAMVTGRRGELALGIGNAVSITALTIGLLATHWWMRDTTMEDRWARIPVWLRTIVLVGVIVTLALIRGDNRAFIYFQF
jgi:D-alanyl-lipoteichoic acid acyltransferase DltB (MBOAT superfamily)